MHSAGCLTRQHFAASMQCTVPGCCGMCLEHQTDSGLRLLLHSCVLREPEGRRKASLQRWQSLTVTAVSWLACVFCYNPITYCTVLDTVSLHISWCVWAAVEHHALAECASDEGWRLVQDGKLRLLYRHQAGSTIHSFKGSCCLPAPMEVSPGQNQAVLHHFKTACMICKPRMSLPATVLSSKTCSCTCLQQAAGPVCLCLRQLTTLVTNHWYMLAHVKQPPPSLHDYLPALLLLYYYWHRCLCSCNPRLCVRVVCTAATVVDGSGV